MNQVVCRATSRSPDTDVSVSGMVSMAPELMPMHRLNQLYKCCQQGS